VISESTGVGGRVDGLMLCIIASRWVFWAAMKRAPCGALVSDQIQ
jgi:hypothetical protein